VIAPLADQVREIDALAKPPHITQIAASGAHDEVWAAAKEILRFADAGVPYSQIGVVARTLDPYLDLIESIFRDHKIPYTSSSHRRLDHDPRVKAARLLFTIDDFNRADVLDLLRSPFFRLQGGDPELWDPVSRSMGIGHGAEEWRRRLGDSVGQDYSSAGRQKITLPRAEVDLFWGSIQGLLEAKPPPGTGWKAYSDWALARHRRFLEPDTRVEQALASLAVLEGFALEEPQEALLKALSDLSEPAGGKAGVQALDAMAARGLPFRALIVLGMNERVFPRFILEDPFLRDAVRSRFEYRLGNRMARKVQGYEEEKLLFALLRASAPEIVLTHQRTDEKGRLQIRSSLLPAGTPRQVARQPAQRLEEAPFDLLTPREASLRTRQGETLGRVIGWDVTMRIQAAAFLKEIESRGKPTKYDGLVDGRAFWLDVAESGLSPTSLEKLAQCPHRFFLSRLLAIEELEEPEGEDGLTPIEIGTLYHEILEHCYASGDLSKAAENSFARFETKRTVRYPVYWEVEKERILKVLRAFLKSEDFSFFRTKYFEKEITAELPLAAGGRKTVTFRGILDRLDLGPDGAFRVVDYKRRKSSHYPYKMETGILKKGIYLQPPIYFLLAQSLLGTVDVENSTFVYAFLEDAAEMTLTGSFWAQRAEFEAMLRGLLEKIPRGEFLIRPGDYCRFCEFRTACRKSHLPTRVRARNIE
jgi:ATP-dependent helicase/nuclease subunit B